MTFNYRTIRKQNALGNNYLEIHEIYYNEDGSISHWTSYPKSAFGVTKGELKESLTRMLNSLEAPLLEEFSGTLREVTE